jgi:hypothetical protein
MCIKKIIAWFQNNDPTPIPDPIPVSKKRALLFAINNYPGTGNDLNGCLNDQRDVANKLEELYPGQFDIKKFSDSEVTTYCYETEVEKAIAQLSPGALVIIFADSCFSGTITKFFNDNPHPTKSRFLKNPELPQRLLVNRRFAIMKNEPVKWLTFATCQENQTSADAYINGEYHGAGTYYAFLKALQPDMTYRQWGDAVGRYLPNITFGYDQDPYIEGPSELLDRIVFTGEVLLIHNSSHGTQTHDSNGDESDGYDEALYLYNGIVTDDEINELLQKIPQ